MIGEPYIYNYGRCLAPPNWNFMKMRGCNRLYVIYGGSGWYCDGGTEKPFLPGRIYLLPMRAEFRVRQLPEDPLNHMYFDFLLSSAINPGVISSVDITGDDKKRELLRSMVQAMELLINEEGVPQEVLQSLFVGLLRLVCHMTGHRFSHDNRVEVALERIHKINSDGSIDPPDNAELAELLHMDVNHFIRIFRREVGVTPYKYILSHRLNMAAAYISDGESLTDAARLVGYESASALSHAMKRRRGG